MLGSGKPVLLSTTNADSSFRAHRHHTTIYRLHFSHLSFPSEFSYRSLFISLRLYYPFLYSLLLITVLCCTCCRDRWGHRHAMRRSEDSCVHLVLFSRLFVLLGMTVGLQAFLLSISLGPPLYFLLKVFFAITPFLKRKPCYCSCTNTKSNTVPVQLRNTIFKEGNIGYEHCF